MDIGFQFTKEMRLKSAMVIAQRIAPLTLLNVFLYLALLYGVTQTPKQNEWSFWLGGLMVANSLGLAFLSFRRKQLSLGRDWRWGLYFLIFLMAAVWGAVGAVTQYYVALGWTSFFVMLMQLFVSASHLTVLVPNLVLQMLFQLALLLPSAVINLFWVQGFQGYAIGFFLLGYLAIMLSTGWMQFRQFWNYTRNAERLEAMFNSMPGTLAWVNAKKQVSKMNPELEKLFNEDDGNPVVFDQFTERVLRGQGNKVSGLVEFGKKKMILSGKPYQFNNEAIVLGVDVTDQHLIQEQLEFQRSQSQNSARWATLGEVVGDIVADLPAKLDQAPDSISQAWPLLHKLTLGQLHQKEGWFSLRDCVAACEQFYQAKARAESVEFKVVYQGRDLCVDGSASDIMLVVLSLINNAFDAVATTEKKEITVELKIDGNSGELSVSDTGVGIDRHLTEVIFEPNFTTKKANESTGLGLSLSKQLVEMHKGKLTVDIQNDTVFSVHLTGRPVAEGAGGCG